MKKVLLMMFIAVMATTMSAQKTKTELCIMKGNTAAYKIDVNDIDSIVFIESVQEDTPKYDYSLVLSAVYNEELGAPEVSVILSEEGVPFVLVPFKSEALTNTKESAVFEAIIQVYGSELSKTVNTKSGTYQFNGMSWDSNTQYTIVGFVVDVNTLEQKSAMASAEVLIPEKSTNLLSLQYDGDSCLYIAATTQDPYYYTLTNEDIYNQNIGSGNTSVAQFVAESFESDVEYAYSYYTKQYDNVTYTDVAELYVLSGSQKVNMVYDYAEISAGTYYALAAGIEYTVDEVGITANPTTEGVAIKFTLNHDYTYSQVRSMLRSLNEIQIIKPARDVNFSIDLKKMYKASRVE